MRISLLNFKKKAPQNKWRLVKKERIASKEAYRKNVKVLLIYDLSKPVIRSAHGFFTKKIPEKSSRGDSFMAVLAGLGYCFNMETRYGSPCLLLWKNLSER